MHNVFDNWFRGGCRSSHSMPLPTPFYKRKSRKSFTFCYRRRVSSALVLSAGTKQICLSRTLRLGKLVIIRVSEDWHPFFSLLLLHIVHSTLQRKRHTIRCHLPCQPPAATELVETGITGKSCKVAIA